MQFVLAALIPTLVVGALLIGVVAWRERTAAAQERGREEIANRQLDEMHRLGDNLAAVKAESKQWQERWLADTRKLADDLSKSNAALLESAKEQEKAQAAIGELAKQLADLGSQLKQLQDASKPAQPAPTGK